MPSADQLPINFSHDYARVNLGCPDRRIDRLSHHTRCTVQSRLRRECDGFLVAFVPSHHRTK